MHYLRDYLITNGFTQSITDECMYILPTDNYLIMVTTHVDDLLIVAQSKRHHEKFRQLLQRKWDINIQEGNDLSYIGMTIRRNRRNRTTAVSQQKYLEDIVDKCSELHVA
jgi:hypothetical protein